MDNVKVNEVYQRMLDAASIKKEDLPEDGKLTEDQVQKISDKIEDISKDEPMVKVLEEIFKEKGLHEFKKAEFAHLVKQQISSENDISEEIKLIINNIKKLFHTKR